MAQVLVEVMRLAWPFVLVAYIAGALFGSELGDALSTPVAKGSLYSTGVVGGVGEGPDGLRPAEGVASDAPVGGGARAAGGRYAPASFSQLSSPTRQPSSGVPPADAGAESAAAFFTRGEP